MSARPCFPVAPATKILRLVALRVELDVISGLVRSNCASRRPARLGFVWELCGNFVKGNGAGHTSTKAFLFPFFPFIPLLRFPLSTFPARGGAVDVGRKPMICSQLRSRALFLVAEDVHYRRNFQSAFQQGMELCGCNLVSRTAHDLPWSP